MKLILTHEVDGLGAPGDVVEVKDGYGRNFLLPRKLATPWTRGGQTQVDAIRRARRATEHASLDGAMAARERLQATAITLTKRSGRAGRLFGAVTQDDIAEAIAAAGGPAIDRRTVMLRRPIKSLGTHAVVVRLHPEVTAALDVEVIDPDNPEALSADTDQAAEGRDGGVFQRRETPLEPLPEENLLGDAEEADGDDAGAGEVYDEDVDAYAEDADEADTAEAPRA